MPSTAIVFGSLSPVEAALLCIAVYLLFHARKLAFLTSATKRSSLDLLTITVFLLAWAATSFGIALL